MSCVLTKGRTEPCKDNVGGIKHVYLFPFVEYSYTQIEGLKSGEITSFPETTLYKYEITNGDFSETISNDENGISYSQTLTFTLFKQDLKTTNELNRVQKLDLRYIVEYNDGNLKMGGVLNGANLENFTIDSGGSKSSLNGYNLTITSDESIQAPFISDLGVFGGYLLLETDFNILLETGDKIILQ